MRELTNYRRQLRRFVQRAMGAGNLVPNVTQAHSGVTGKEAELLARHRADGATGDPALWSAPSFMAGFSAVDGSHPLQ